MAFQRSQLIFYSYIMLIYIISINLEMASRTKYFYLVWAVLLISSNCQILREDTPSLQNTPLNLRRQPQPKVQVTRHSPKSSQHQELAQQLHFKIIGNQKLPINEQPSPNPAQLKDQVGRMFEAQITENFLKLNGTEPHVERKGQQTNINHRRLSKQNADEKQKDRPQLASKLEKQKQKQGFLSLHDLKVSLLSPTMSY